MLVARWFDAREDGLKTNDDHNLRRTYRSKARTSFPR